MLKDTRYTTIKIPKGLAEKIDECLKKHPEYANRTEIIRTAIRDYLNLLNNGNDCSNCSKNV